MFIAPMALADMIDQESMKFGKFTDEDISEVMHQINGHNFSTMNLVEPTMHLLDLEGLSKTDLEQQIATA